MNLRSVTYSIVWSTSALFACTVFITGRTTRIASSGQVSPSCEYFWLITVSAKSEILFIFPFQPCFYKKSVLRRTHVCHEKRFQFRYVPCVTSYARWVRL